MAQATTSETGLDQDTREHIHAYFREHLPDLREDYEVVHENSELVVFRGATRELDGITDYYDVPYDAAVSMMWDECPSILSDGSGGAFEYGVPFVVRKQ